MKKPKKNVWLTVVVIWFWAFVAVAAVIICALLRSGLQK